MRTMVHLQEPIHSGEYLAEQMINVTDDYSITPAIFTVTRDNASANTVMLLEYEKLASTHLISLKQPWTFTAKEGDVRCIGHIINLAIQAALASLKAMLDERLEEYRSVYYSSPPYPCSGRCLISSPSRNPVNPPGGIRVEVSGAPAQ